MSLQNTYREPAPFLKIDFAGDIAVSTLTTILDWIDASSYMKVTVFMINTGAVDITFKQETSENQTHLEPGEELVKVCKPGEQVSFELGPAIMRQFYTWSGETDPATHPAGTCKLRQRIQPR
jgi:hypothetical protein